MFSQSSHICSEIKKLDLCLENHFQSMFALLETNHVINCVHDCGQRGKSFALSKVSSEYLMLKRRKMVARTWPLSAAVDLHVTTSCRSSASTAITVSPGGTRKVQPKFMFVTPNLEMRKSSELRVLTGIRSPPNDEYPSQLFPFLPTLRWVGSWACF